MTIRRFVAAALVALPAALAVAQDAGKPAPDFQLPSGDKTLKLSELRGRVVYLDFWASWCGPCRQSFPWMNGLQEKYAAQGLTIVGVNVDQKRADADKFLADTPAKFTLAYDASGATPKAYGVKVMPTSLLIGPDGTVQAVHKGFREADRDELEAMIKSALAKR